MAKGVVQLMIGDVVHCIDTNRVYEYIGNGKLSKWPHNEFKKDTL